MNVKLYLFIFIFQLFMTIKHFIKCKDINIFKTLVFLAHHLLDVYVFFGFLVNETKNEILFHLILLISLLIHWFTNNYNCILTTYLNDLCKFNKNDWFYSLIFIIYKLTDIYYIHSYWLFTVILYDIYKLFLF